MRRGAEGVGVVGGEIDEDRPEAERVAGWVEAEGDGGG